MASKHVSCIDSGIFFLPSILEEEEEEPLKGG